MRKALTLVFAPGRCHPSRRRILATAPRDGMDLNDDAQQLAAVAAALALGDCAAVVQLTRAAATAAVREAGCMALMELAETKLNSPDHTTGGADEMRDVVGALVSTLRAQPVSVDVLHVGLEALRWWCKLSPAHCACAGAAGAVDAVVEALRVDTAEPLLQEAGCFALAMLFAHMSANLRFAASAHAVDALLAAMRAHPSCAAASMRRTVFCHF
jgi:hypothetical protein